MVEELTPREVAARLKRAPDELFLLDVREPDERATAAILPSVHIPMREVPARTSELPKEKEIVVYCHGGTRSMMVAGFLESRGFRRVANLAGGIDAWSVTVDPTVPRYD
ncbi:MAG TPA: rhodanese-like domain-containing protein [Thermoplasmata archaeon]|nr:rhodanese-like domain-containing protein [Thermoplasmata archaeon]